MCSFTGAADNTFSAVSRNWSEAVSASPSSIAWVYRETTSNAFADRPLGGNSRVTTFFAFQDGSDVCRLPRTNQ